MKKIIIIGAGAAGMLAAITAKNKNNKVTILEGNNNPGKKILITGNGKCNYFNDDFNISHYRSDDINTLNKIINDENKKIIIEFFKSIGIEPKIKNGYYYPYSNQAVSIQNALILKCKELGIEIVTDTKVTSLVKDKDKFIINNNIVCDKVVLACGSKACPKTGSDGSGYILASNFNLKIKKVLPALVQLKSSNKILKSTSGIRTDSKISLYIDNNFMKEEEGELQLTDYGISGICTLQLSSDAIRYLDKGKKVSIRINFLPFVNNYDNWLKTRLNNIETRNIIELFEGVLNYKLLFAITKYIKIDSNKKYDELNNKEKEILKNSLLSFNLDIDGYNDFDKAQVASGGILLSEIDIDTMMSNKIDNLYIIGEMLDVDGDCGGYNLAFAWISGYIAGRNINND